VRVKVLYFGILKDQFGAAEQQVELPGGANVAELLELLRGQTSNSAMGNPEKNAQEEQLWRSLAVAVNREYGSASTVLRDGDEVALLPPVSGGSFAEGESLAARAKAGVVRDGSALALLAMGSPETRKQLPC
jgi:molybdopterin converting factor subunit 1